MICWKDESPEFGSLIDSNSMSCVTVSLIASSEKIDNSLSRQYVSS